MAQLIRTSWVIRTVFRQFPSYEIVEPPVTKSNENKKLQNYRDQHQNPA